MESRDAITVTEMDVDEQRPHPHWRCYGLCIANEDILFRRCAAIPIVLGVNTYAHGASSLKERCIVAFGNIYYNIIFVIIQYLTLKQAF